MPEGGSDLPEGTNPVTQGNENPPIPQVPVTSVSRPSQPPIASKDIERTSDDSRGANVSRSPPRDDPAQPLPVIPTGTGPANQTPIPLENGREGQQPEMAVGDVPSAKEAQASTEEPTG